MLKYNLKIFQPGHLRGTGRVQAPSLPSRLATRVVGIHRRGGQVWRIVCPADGCQHVELGRNLLLCVRAATAEGTKFGEVDSGATLDGVTHRNAETRLHLRDPGRLCETN